MRRFDAIDAIEDAVSKRTPRRTVQFFTKSADPPQATTYLSNASTQALFLSETPMVARFCRAIGAAEGCPTAPHRFPPSGAPEERWPVNAQANGASSFPFSRTLEPFTFSRIFTCLTAEALGEEGGVAPVRKSSCSSSSSSSSSSDELDSSMGCGGICIIGGTAYSIGAFGTNCGA